MRYGSGSIEETEVGAGAVLCARSKSMSNRSIGTRVVLAQMSRSDLRRDRSPGVASVPALRQQHYVGSDRIELERRCSDPSIQSQISRAG